MKQARIVLFTAFVVILTACAINEKSVSNEKMENMSDTLNFKSGYADVNGLKMYYEIYGFGKPLVLIHGGGSTIQSSFGRLIPLLAKNSQIIAVEMQAHGRTNDRDTALSFEQDADDIATLLHELKIEKASIFGFSNGGTTAMQFAIRHPEMVDKIILGSALCKRNGVPDQFWEFMQGASLDNMPKQLQTAYLEVSPNPEGLQLMHDRDAKRMVEFKDISDELIKSIQAPTLIINGDRDVILPEHALLIHRLISNSRLAILPSGHGDYIGEITTLTPNTTTEDFAVTLIEHFLDEPAP